MQTRYLPKKKADKFGLTRSPQDEFFGFCNRHGPHRPIIRAPTGAVRRMESTATVSTSMPYFCICSSCLVLAMSNAVEPIAAWKLKNEFSSAVLHVTTSKRLNTLFNFFKENTCTVALGIQARAINSFSRMLKPANNTQT